MSDNAKFAPNPAHSLSAPDVTVNAREVFGIDVDMAVPISQSYWDQLQLLLIKRCMAKKHVNAAKRHIIVMLLNKVSEAIFAIAVLVIMTI